MKLGVEPGEENAEWLRSTFREDGQAGKGRTACRFAIVQPDRWDFLAERRAGLSIVVLRLVTPGVRREALEVGRAHIERLCTG